jgi:hypothetical protein
MANQTSMVRELARATLSPTYFWAFPSLRSGRALCYYLFAHCDTPTLQKGYPLQSLMQGASLMRKALVTSILQLIVTFLCLTQEYMS